jgi:Methionine synthase I (cobalamin-dependent), methyltransferase domain
MKNNGAQFEQLLRERVVIIDGAMGTMIQGYHLDEAAIEDVSSRVMRMI